MNIVSRRSRTEPPASLSDLLALYVSRLVRQHLVAQYVALDHQVFTDGHLLLQQAACRIKSHLSATTPPWHLRGQLGRMVVTTHIRELALQRLNRHDVDSEARTDALARIYREDFVEIWPNDWLDA